MKFEFAGEQYKIGFSYATIGKKSALGRIADMLAPLAASESVASRDQLAAIALFARKMDLGGKRQRRITSCVIKCGDEVRYSGTAKLRPTERFTKELGRTWALMAALTPNADGLPDREFRAAAWGAYHGRKKPLKQWGAFQDLLNAKIPVETGKGA